jgi:hypothetical protein
MRVIDDRDDPFLERRLVPFANCRNFSERRVVTTHAEHSIGHHTHALDLAAGRNESVIQFLEVEVSINDFIGWLRQAYHIDDAVVIQRVTHDQRVARNQLRQYADHRGIRCAHHHRGFATVKCGQLAFQLDVLRVGPADETHRARAGTEQFRYPSLGVDHSRMHAQSKIGVRIHAKERSVTVAFEQIALA